MYKVKRIQELRRSNAATAIPSKKKYSRKEKYKKRFEQLKNRAHKKFRYVKTTRRLRRVILIS